jgi:3-methylcrotonyl-CoA carboxylase alpha subunit
MTSISRLLVANRGEIARRIFRTCRAQGVQTVAVFSDADAGAPHQLEADLSVRIGAAPSRESYLLGERVLDAAKRTGADAIHPGYGFLAENADFAEAVIAAGLLWVGPPPSAMRALGEKAPARQLAAAHGVPTVPGYDGEDDSEARLVAEAERIGFPVLLKASFGGGGRGMRRVDAADGLIEAIASARREAEAAFGNGRLLLERYVERPRHIEVQVLGDAHGNVVHLFERECSIQRRHQKILEEAPSPAVGPELRAALGDAAVRLAKAVGYVSAGTVEFIVDPEGRFYFLEMNTRLQVEHPVTELITGLDLVALQLAIAEGRPLPFTQDQLVLRGHAIEVRLCAEDPNRDYAGGTGVLQRIRFPEAEGLRVDTGFEQGQEVGIHYDNLLAKVITFGDDRAVAARRMRDALARTWVAGVVNNLPLLRDLVADEAFLAGDLDTAFLARRGLPRPPPVDLPGTAAVAAAIGVSLEKAAQPLAGVVGGFRVDGPAASRERWAFGDQIIETVAWSSGLVEVGGQTRRLGVSPRGDGAWQVEEDGVSWLVQVARVGTGPLVDGEALYLSGVLGEGMLTLVPRFPPPAAAVDEPGACVAPTPGMVRAVLVAVGDAVAKGDALVVLEAMKMEHSLRAPCDGTVVAVRVAVGASVDAGALLVRVEADG